MPKLPVRLVALACALASREIDSDLAKAVSARRRDRFRVSVLPPTSRRPSASRLAVWPRSADGSIRPERQSVCPSVPATSFARSALVVSSGPGCSHDLLTVPRDSSSRNAYTGVSEDQGGWTGRGMVGARTQDRLGGSASDQEYSNRRRRR